VSTFRRDDSIMLDGEPRSKDRKRSRRSLVKPAPALQPIGNDPELREQGLAKGKVVVTDAAGNVSIAEPVRSTQQRRRRRKPKRVDPCANTRKLDRSITPEQRSALAALARDRQLNFDPRNAATLTRGQAAQLIAKLTKTAKRRQNINQAQLDQQRKRNKRRVVKS